MWPIHVARLDKARPVLILTRELVRPYMTAVTVAPITTTVRGLSTEVAVDAANGLSGPSAVSCDNITTIPTSALGEQIGTLLDPDQVAEDVVSGLLDERFLILPNPEVGEYFRRKATDYDRWLRGMQRLMQRSNKQV